MATKIFISWSGDLSKAVGRHLATWLPTVVPGINPFLSDTDIELGVRSLNTLRDELAGTDLGIVCVTRENQDKPWINFEAGALSKLDGSKVIPFLVDFDSPAEVTGPITQFQMLVDPTREKVELLQKSINKELTEPLGETVLATLLDRGWAAFESGLTEAIESAQELGARPRRTDRQMIEETLTLVRSMHNAEPAAVFIDAREVLPGGWEWFASVGGHAYSGGPHASKREALVEGAKTLTAERPGLNLVHFGSTE